MPVKKKGYKKSDPAAFMRLLGGRKLASQMIKDANALNALKADGNKWNELVNFGLPEIKDMEGPAEC